MPIDSKLSDQFRAMLSFAMQNRVEDFMSGIAEMGYQLHESLLALTIRVTGHVVVETAERYPNDQATGVSRPGRNNDKKTPFFRHQATVPIFMVLATPRILCAKRAPRANDRRSNALMSSAMRYSAWVTTLSSR